MIKLKEKLENGGKRRRKVESKGKIDKKKGVIRKQNREHGLRRERKVLSEEEFDNKRRERKVQPMHI